MKSYGLTKAAVMDEKNDLSSHDGLLKEYKRLGIQLKQLQILERRTSDQLAEMRRDEIDVADEITKFSNLNVSFAIAKSRLQIIIFLCVQNLREEAAAKMEQLAATLDELRKKERTTTGVIDEARKRNIEIKVRTRRKTTVDTETFFFGNSIKRF